jgi:hypothetical protein
VPARFRHVDALDDDNVGRPRLVDSRAAIMTLGIIFADLTGQLANRKIKLNFIGDSRFARQSTKIVGWIGIRNRESLVSHDRRRVVFLWPFRRSRRHNIMSEIEG